MNVIYQPTGRAREYSQLACNIFSGCAHGCTYCYCPAITRKTLDEWKNNSRPRPNIIEKFRKDAERLNGDPREILFCFMSDPYQNDESTMIMGELLLIAQENKLKIQILTKAGSRAIKHFPLLEKNNWKFGSTISFCSELMREHWEPGAPSIASRIEAVKMAHEEGISTWVSVEPVITAGGALEVMHELIGYVDLWKVGKLNHFPEFEKDVDWRKFLKDTRHILNGENVYIKKDLLKYEN